MLAHTGEETRLANAERKTIWEGGGGGGGIAGGLGFGAVQIITWLLLVLGSQLPLVLRVTMTNQSDCLCDGLSGHWLHAPGHASAVDISVRGRCLGGCLQLFSQDRLDRGAYRKVSSL